MNVSCHIEFEGDNGSYRPGDVIRGLVIFKISGSSILIRGLSLKFCGFATTRWEKQQNKKDAEKNRPKEYYTEREDYISTMNYLLGSEEANAMQMQVGEYKYNFMVHVPNRAPSSFESPLGTIRYELSVQADYVSSIDMICSHTLNVEDIKDLRPLSGILQAPVEREIHEKKRCIKFWQTPIKLYVNIPQSGFIAGEYISVHIKISNHGRIKLDGIKYKLNRVITCKGYTKDVKNTKCFSETTSLVTHVHSLFGQNSNVIQHLQQICIPRTPPTISFEDCKCLSLSYAVVVELISLNQKRYLEASIPITMGSISLSSDVKILPQTNGDVASGLIVARSMDELNLPSSMDMAGEAAGSSSSLGFNYPHRLLQETAEFSSSVPSLAAYSFQDAEFMSTVQLNKKSKIHLSNGKNDEDNFKPKYLYYDLPNELQAGLDDCGPSTSSFLQRQIQMGTQPQAPEEETDYCTKTKMDMN